VHIREAEQSALAEQALAAFEASQAPAQIPASTPETLPAVIVRDDQRSHS
jgi:hypothetical protein